MGFSSLWTASDSTLEKVIWAIFIGIIIASVIYWFNQRIIGKPVRLLNKKQINTPGKAMTLSEMGIDGPVFRCALKSRNGALGKVIMCTNDKEKLTKQDFTTARFYIPEQLRIKSELKYRAKNTTVPVIIITAVVMLIVAMLCIKYIPVLLDMYNGK